MQAYASREEFVEEVGKRAQLFIREFEGVAEQEKDLLVDGVDCSPAQMIAYQLGWMSLIQQWEQDELAGKEVVTPHPDYKWNQLGPLYQTFYDSYRDWTLVELIREFQTQVERMIDLTLSYRETEFQQASSRKWASSTPSNGPIWKWLHINTVAPFKNFRSKIHKLKKIKNS